MRKKDNFGTLRIIGGRWRGRKLKVPPVEEVRPTTDMLRETLFNWLSPIIQGAHCLDLFAGSGALGFEALSRGAACVTFIDSSPEVVKQLEETALHLGATAEILHADACSAWESKNKPFHLVFLDPPFHQNLIEPACAFLDSHDILCKNAYIYLETEGGFDSLPTPSHWHVIREKKQGQVSAYLIWRE